MCIRDRRSIANTYQNQAVVSQAEKIVNEFKPVTYDVSAQVKAIESFESVAVCMLWLTCAGEAGAGELCEARG